MSEAKTTAKARMPRDEAVRLGKEIYQNLVLPHVEADHHGEYVAIDVATRKWAVASTTRDAIEGLREQAPMPLISYASGLATELCAAMEAIRYGEPNNRGGP